MFLLFFLFLIFSFAAETSLKSDIFSDLKTRWVLGAEQSVLACRNPGILEYRIPARWAICKKSSSQGKVVRKCSQMDGKYYRKCLQIAHLPQILNSRISGFLQACSLKVLQFINIFNAAELFIHHKNMYYI